MSPLEAKQYGIIDHVIGGDEAGFKVRMFFNLAAGALCASWRARDAQGVATTLCPSV